MSRKKEGGKLNIFFILVFLLQLIVSNYVHLGPYVFICFIPLLTVLMPLNWRPASVMLAAFGLGLLLDLLSDGVPGLNAGAAVFCAALRKPFYRILVNSDRQDKTIRISRKSIGNTKYFSLLAACILAFSLAFVLLDSLDFSN